MNTIGVVLLAAATATSGIDGMDGVDKPHAGGLHFFRPHVVQHSAPPPGGPMTGAGMGAPNAGFAGNRRFPNTRTQIYFVDPLGMKVTWQTGSPTGDRLYLPPQLEVPARYNFNQGYIYRLKLTDIPARKGLVLYPTIEVAPSTPATDAFLTHNPVPCQFTEEDFDQVQAGNFVTKVVYLPDPKYQELAIAGVETLVSTRLEPGVDPIREADRRGTILMIIRVGQIDLEMPANSMAGMTVAPGTTVNTMITAPGTIVPPPTAAPAAPGAFTTTPEAVPPAPATSVPPAPAVPAPVPAPGIEPAPAPAPAPGIEPAPAPEPPPAPGMEPAPVPAPGDEPAAPETPNPANPAAAKSKSKKDGKAVVPASVDLPPPSLDLPAPAPAKP